MAGSINNAASASTQVVNTPIVTGGAAEGGYLTQQRDAKESATAPKFGDIYQQIQAKYGAKAEKPREIKKTLGKDDFLRIMITQMKNQDPTKPFDAEKMAAQIAQFTSVEQLQNVNQNLTKLSEQNKPIERMSMTNMIGKLITVDRERFPHAEGVSDSLTYGLPRDAADVKVAIISEGGEVVYEKNLGAQKAGAATFSWDGNKTNTLPAKGGSYMFRIEAKDDRGMNIDTNAQSQARVVGVSFEGSEPVFLIGDAKHQEKVTLKNIIRIEQDQSAPAIPGAQPFGPTAAAAAAAGAAPGGITPLTQMQKSAPSFITFEKGKGSATIGSEAALPQEALQAIARYQEQQQAPTQSQSQNPSQNPSPNQAPTQVPVQNPVSKLSSGKIMALPPGMLRQGPSPAAMAPRAADPREERGFPNGLSDNLSESQAQPISPNMLKSMEGGENR